METKQTNKSTLWRNSSVNGDKSKGEEKCLITETQKLRKYGSTQDNNQQSDNVLMDTIGNLEKEVKFWQREAEKLSQLIELNDKKIQFTSSKYSMPKKKTNKEMKRYDKIVKRSHSVETSQRKSKEFEFEKLKVEKLQMKNLLNNLERQVIEIQSNVTKISDERQKYKDLYYMVKDKCEQSENINVNIERTIRDLSNENSKISFQQNKLNEELEVILKDNKQLKQNNQNMIREMSQIKIQYEQERKELETNLTNLAKENHDIAVRSSNLKSSIVSLEEDFKAMEEELKTKCLQITNLIISNNELDSELNNVKHQTNEKSESLNAARNKGTFLEESNVSLQRNEQLLLEKIEKNRKEINELIKKDKEKNDLINNMKISFSANIVKLENHLQKSEQILSSKIKLISSLELKISNSDRELKLMEEEILLLKKTLNSKEHDLEILNNKYEEVNERKTYLEQQSENIMSNYETNNREINEMKRTQELSKNEIKSLKEDLNRKEDQFVIIERQIERFEKNLTMKGEELSKNKKLISHLNNDIEKKECHISSLLSLLEGKEEKIISILSSNEQQERKVKEYVEQLRNYDNSTIQFSARNTALEEEIEILSNNIVRLTRQKEHLSQMLTSRNKTIGQLQEQLADKNERIHKTDDLEERNYFKNFEEVSYPESKVHRKSRSNEKSVNLTNKINKNPIQNQVLPNQTIESLSDNYDPKALRSRAQSNNDRSIPITNAT